MILAHGPLPQSNEDEWRLGQLDTPAALADAIDRWFAGARRVFGTLVGDHVPYFRPQFRWETAVGRPARRYAGASLISTLWRELASRAYEVAAILGRGRLDPYLVYIISRHHAKVTAAPARASRAPRVGTDVVVKWASAFRAAVDAGRALTAHSLASLASNRAAGIEKAVGRARGADYRLALAATGDVRRPGPRTPSRLAFRFVRGFSGWARSPVDENRFDDDVPDEGDMEGCTLEQGCSQPAAIDSRSVLSPLSEQGALNKEAAAWAAQWAVGDQYQSPDFPPQLLVSPQPITLWALDTAAASFPAGTGLGADNLAPRAVLRLGDAARLMLVQIFLAAEAIGAWSSALDLVLIVLLPKPDGGLRPIGLFPTLIRLWMRTRSVVARAWEAAHEVPCIFGGIGKGAQRAAWAASFAAEVAAAGAHQHVASLLDLVKAFERIPHHLLARAAARLGYNLVILRLSLAAYRLSRAIGVEGTFSILLVATRGITAGSSFATTELRLLLHESVVIAQRNWPLLQLCLYVDDLTVAASGTADSALSTVAQCTNLFVRVLEDGFGLEVSCAKSFAVAARPSLAARLARSTKRRVLQSVRTVKLLGAPFAGGRRRSVRTIKNRLKEFRRRARSIHLLRRQRIDVARVVRSMGAPGFLYGIDIMGASDTHLHSARVAAAAAALPPGASRNVDIAFAILDAGSGRSDPAYLAHSAPVKHWCMAIWQAWAQLDDLDNAFQAALRKLSGVRAAGRSVWSAVAGPVATVIATVWRLGWVCVSSRIFFEDLDDEWNLLAISPALIAEAVCRSVDRWRQKRVCAALPALTRGLDLSSNESMIMMITRPIGALLRATGRAPRTVPQWTQACRAQLLSASTGCQRPQVRIARMTNVDVDDVRCQLCLTAPGTLLHRRTCPATQPTGGWPQPPPAAQALLDKIGLERATLLRTRGFLAIGIRRPLPQEEAAVRWLGQPPDVTRTDLVWYTDGSLMFGSCWELRRTGCGIVVVSSQGDLLAYGQAVPPS